MKVLVACEMSGRVRDAFIAQGHDAISCDIMPSLSPGPHIQGDVLPLLVQGAKHFKDNIQGQIKAIQFFLAFTSAPIDKIAIENPVGIMSSHYRKPDQIIQPYMFGHGETKATCLWLKNLPKLVATDIVAGRVQRVHRMPPSSTRSIERSLTYTGIAKAMSVQWGSRN